MAAGNRILALLALGLIFASTSSAEIIDAVVATVDKEVILRSDILNEIEPAIQGLGEAEVKEYFDTALEQAIDQKILYREGVLLGLPITDEMIEEDVKAFREKYYDSEEEFLKALADDGRTISDFRESRRKAAYAYYLGVNKRAEFAKEISISEAEIAQYYEDHKSEYQKPERVKLYRIFIAAEKGNAASRATALARIQALREELSLGADFSKLAQQHSEGPAASQGGFVGWIGRGELVADLEEVAFSLAPGDISPVIETEFGMMLLKAEEKVEAGLAPFEEVRDEIEPALRESYADAKYRKWMAELRKRSRVRTHL